MTVRILRSHIGVAAGALLVALAIAPATAVAQLTCSAPGATASASEVMAANTRPSESPSDYVVPQRGVQELRGAGTVTIRSAGTYRLRGTIRDGQVVVESTGNGIVRLVLAGATVTSSSGPAIWVKAAAKMVIVLQRGTRNSLTDGISRAAGSSNAAALYSSAPLAIGGPGVLAVRGRHADGIASTESLVVAGGVITVIAKDDGVRGKQMVYLRGGSLDVTSVGDGIRSSGKAANSVGYVEIAGARVVVRSQSDGIQGMSDVIVASGSLRVDAAGTGLKSSCVTYLGSATVSVRSGGAAVQSDGEVALRGGRLTVTKCSRGIVARGIAVSGGSVEITSTDDGLHASGITPTTTNTTPPVYSNSVPAHLQVDGGTFVIRAGANGIDAHGTASMQAGRVIVGGSATDTHTAVTADQGFAMSGGSILALDASGLLSLGIPVSGLPTLAVDLPALQSAGTIVQVVAVGGRVVARAKSPKAFRSLLLASSSLARGAEYRVLVGGSVAGQAVGFTYAKGSTTGARQAMVATAR